MRSRHILISETSHPFSSDEINLVHELFPDRLSKSFHYVETVWEVRVGRLFRSWI